MSDPAAEDSSPQAAASRAGAEVETTASESAQREHTAKTQPADDAEKAELDYLLTTDPAAQNDDPVIDPTAS